MGGLQKPERLPEEFAEIWDALSEADQASPSRQALAGRLGLSTHTIQRILVDGDVPDLRATRNTRIRRAWVRILARLALATGNDPGTWIEAVGIPYNDDARSTAEDAIHKARVRAGKAGSAGIAGPGGAMPGRDLPAAATPGYLWPDQIRIGLAGRGVLSSQLAGFEGSFLEIFVRRLAGAVNPSTRLRMQDLDEQEVVSGLLSARPQLDLGVGITETVHRRFLGLNFLPIPGISTRFGAICLRRQDRAGEVPEWNQAILPGKAIQVYFLVTAGDVAQDYLIGQCGVPKREVLVTEDADPGRIGRALLEATAKNPEGWVVYVGGHDVCGLVADGLERADGFAGVYTVEDIPGAEEECPRYPVGIALRPGAGAWHGILKAARDEELIGASARRTAGLYASLMIASFLDRNPAGLPSSPRTRGMIELNHFGQATSEFQEVLFRHLVVGLKQVLLMRLESEGTVQGADAIESLATERATAYAEGLIPHLWLQAIEESIAVAETAEAYRSTLSFHRKLQGERLPWCQSCSVSLADEHNRGASEHFCRFCSDEEGNLKSRGKVQNLIARWFERWQEDLNHEEAMRRAGLFMTAMPAWSKN